MDSKSLREKIVVIIDDDDPEPMEVAQVNPRHVGLASKKSPGSSSQSASPTLVHTPRTAKLELPEMPSWMCRASSSNLPLGKSRTFDYRKSASKNPTICVNYSDGNRPKTPSLIPRSHSRSGDDLTCVTTPQRDPSHCNENANLPIRNLPIVAPLRSLDTVVLNGVKVNSMANLELSDGDFIRVRHIVQDTTTSEVSLRGWIFRRAKEMNGMLERKLNELCWILHVDENDGRDLRIQGMESVPVSKVVRRRFIRMTNRPFPELSWREHPIEAEEVIRDERVLVCRYKYVCYYPDAAAREQNDWCEKALQRLRVDECDPSCGQADEALRNSWRGLTIKGGACKSLVPGEVGFLQRKRQNSSDAGRLEVRKIRRGSLSAHDHAECQSEIRRESVASLIMEHDLPETPEITMDDDLQEIDPPLLLTQASDSLELQSYLKSSGTASQNIGKSLETDRRHRPFACLDKSYQLKVQENSKFEVVHPVKKQQLSMQSGHAAKGNSIDLTQDEPKHKAELCSLFDVARSAHFDQTDFHAPSSRSSSPEVVEIRAQIETSCKLGTVRRVYQGQVISTYLPNQFGPLQASHDSKSALSSTCTMRPPPVNQSDKKSSLGNPLAAGARQLPTPASQGKDGLSSVAEQRYTFGDCFCGAGGTSRGAVDAGLRVEWGFDFDLPACKSYAMNYAGANVYNVDAHRFSGLTDKDHKVDICHLSPPCQFFSDAHTVQGKDDDRNIASLFAVFELLNKAKPRVVTLEQTSGLLRRHPIFLNAVILMFTARGFSIRWRIIDCADYGLPQRRHRLFMIASCPGETLPTFAKPTHTRDVATQPDLKPWVTINQAISSIPSDWADHDIASAGYIKDGKPYDGDGLAKCITTSGGGNIHPNGQRNLTIREFACLQGFPLKQEFFTSGAKRQIGNAVPPMVAKAMFEEIKLALMKADGIL